MSTDDDQDMGDNVSDESHFDGDHDNQINSEQTKTSVKAKLLSLLQVHHVTLVHLFS